MSDSPQSIARKIAIALVREAKDVGWLRAKIECKPDGSVLLDASMSEHDSDGDFNVDNLRMGQWPRKAYLNSYMQIVAIIDLFAVLAANQ